MIEYILNPYVLINSMWMATLIIIAGILIQISMNGSVSYM